MSEQTCPTECVETNHPGMEHEQWLPPEQEAAVMRIVETVRPHWDEIPTPPTTDRAADGDLGDPTSQGGVSDAE